MIKVTLFSAAMNSTATRTKDVDADSMKFSEGRGDVLTLLRDGAAVAMFRNWDSAVLIPGKKSDEGKPTPPTPVAAKKKAPAAIAPVDQAPNLSQIPEVEPLAAA